MGEFTNCDIRYHMFQDQFYTKTQNIGILPKRNDNLRLSRYSGVFRAWHGNQINAT